MGGLGASVLGLLPAEAPASLESVGGLLSFLGTNIGMEAAVRIVAVGAAECEAAEAWAVAVGVSQLDPTEVSLPAPVAVGMSRLGPAKARLPAPEVAPAALAGVAALAAATGAANSS